MKYHRLDARPILRDSVPAHVLSEVDEYTDKELVSLQPITLNSDTSIWVQTQNRRIAVRSGYHLLNALRFDDPELQMQVLACISYPEVRALVKSNLEKERKDLRDKITVLATYCFGMLIAHSYQECKDTLSNIGSTDLPIAYHAFLGTRSVGVEFIDESMSICKGWNIFGVVIKRMAKEHYENPEKYLTVLPPNEISLLGSPIRMYRRRLTLSDVQVQPSHRDLLTITAQVATRSISKTESFLEE